MSGYRQWIGPWRLDHLRHVWYRNYLSPYSGLIVGAGWETTAFIRAIQWGPCVPERKNQR